MATYKSKPVVIEASQWDESLPLEIIGVQYNSLAGYFVVTAHGQRVYLEHGDWVITEPNGQGYYPCKPDIFANRYELLN